MTYITKTIAGIVAMSVCSLATAGATCTENIRSAILHSNGQIYFLSDKTCANTWCQINWGSDANNKRALAMLLLAKASGKPISFYWPTLNSCTEANPVYTSPDYMSME